IACPFVLEPSTGGSYFLRPMECNPRPGRVASLDDDEQIDLSNKPGVCEPDNWGHRVYLGIGTTIPYPNDADINWRVGLPAGTQHASLYFDRFDLEYGWDFLTLTDGTAHSGTVSFPTYTDTPESTLIHDHMNRSALDLRFTSDSSVNLSGFYSYGFDWTR
ncbi:MAG: hypothetical protein AAGC55_07345, partial [Myxococcota bacterium]